MGKRMDVPPCLLDLGNAGTGVCQWGWPSAWLVIFSSIAEFCLLQGKHGGFEQQRRSNSVSLYPLPFPEFAFWDMPDAGQGLSAQDKPLSVLKQGTVIGRGMARWWVVDCSAPRNSPEVHGKHLRTEKMVPESVLVLSRTHLGQILGNLWSWMVRFKEVVGGWGGQESGA